MSRLAKISVSVLVAGTLLMFAWVLLGNNGLNFAVLNPQGTIAEKQRNLLIFTVGLSLVVVLPVFAMLFMFAWKYRAGNTKADYRPNWDSHRGLEAVWWGIPCAIILLLAVITWRSSHELDPYRALESETKPITIQVVALQWKWLFIYPEYDIASVNLVQFPEKTPVNFVLTADAPMNSFWIPNLGGQIYAMSGMSTKLHLIADRTGDYPGSSANISGEGFADMNFTARATSAETFETWVKDIRSSGADLDRAGYDELAKPAITERPLLFVLKEPALYDKIIMKYTHHQPTKTGADEQKADGAAETHEHATTEGI